MNEIVVSAAGRAVQYVRMSTENQRYSIENQKNAIADYAKRRGYEVIATYADEGRSGLTLRERKELNRLLRDVTDPSRHFSTILVLDISRWGRFQDPDQHAAYEFLCRDMGVNVEYVAEPFENDGSMASSILKHLKRVMAGEYSRDLSVKVSRGQELGASKGFKQGGSALYGFRRLQLDQDGNVRAVLQANERKGFATDRTVIIPGPKEEVAIIRRIFKEFVNQRYSVQTIVRSLIADGIATGSEHPWSYNRVQRILTTELVIGIYVFNQSSSKLKTKLVKNPEALWVRSPMSRPIISQKMFSAAQWMLHHRDHGYSKPKMLAGLRRLLKKEGTLNSVMINACAYVPCVATYRKQFGSLDNVYAEVGYVPGGWSADQIKAANALLQKNVTRQSFAEGQIDMLKGLITLLNEKGALSHDIINRCENLKSAETYRLHFGSLANAYKIIGYKSKAIWHRRSRKGMSEEEILAGVRRIHAEHGFLNINLVISDKGMPSYRWLYKHYGSMLNLYQKAGFNLDRGALVSLARYRVLTHFRKGRPEVNIPYRPSLKTVTDAELIAGIQRLYAKFGYISSRLIEEDEDMPPSRTLYKRFASLYHAYALAGINDTPAQLAAMARNPKLRNWGVTQPKRRRT